MTGVAPRDVAYAVRGIDASGIRVGPEHLAIALGRSDPNGLVFRAAVRGVPVNLSGLTWTVAAPRSKALRDAGTASADAAGLAVDLDVAAARRADGRVGLVATRVRVALESCVLKANDRRGSIESGPAPSYGRTPVLSSRGLRTDDDARPPAPRRRVVFAFGSRKVDSTSKKLGWLYTALGAAASEDVADHVAAALEAQAAAEAPALLDALAAVLEDRKLWDLVLGAAGLDAASIPPEGAPASAPASPRSGGPAASPPSATSPDSPKSPRPSFSESLMRRRRSRSRSGATPESPKAPTTPRPSFREVEETWL